MYINNFFDKLIMGKIFYAIIILFILFVSCTFLEDRNVEVLYDNSDLLIKSDYVEINNKKIKYDLLRFEGPVKPSYGVYFHGSRNEVILVTRPYMEIDWTGENIDKKTKNPVNTDVLVENSNIYLYNDFSVLNVFGRFYTGDNIENDVDDIVNGLRYLSNKTDKVAIHGGSWGGFEAIYAAAISENKPIVGTAFYPPIDFESWYNWSEDTGESFFVPYRERIDNATNKNYSNWNYDFIVNNLETKFILFHSPVDTLVPIDQSENLSYRSKYVDLVYLDLKESPLSHGLFDGEISIEVMIQPVYLMKELTDDKIVGLIDLRIVNSSISDFNKVILLDEQVKYFDFFENRIVSREEILKSIESN